MKIVTWHRNVRTQLLGTCVLFIAGSIALSGNPATAAQSPDRQNRSPVPILGIEVTPPINYAPNWVFTDMMRHSREWRPMNLDYEQWHIVQKQGGPAGLINTKNEKRIPIDKEHPVFMWLYNRFITGDVVLTWEGDGEVLIKREKSFAA